jgi:hypothetical protein
MEKLRAIIFIITLLSGLGSCGTSAVIYGDLVHSYQTCADGWDSPSIGRQGACSHHGGVVTRTIDKRTDSQRLFTYSLVGFGSISLIIAIISVAIGEFVFSIPITGERAIVPLKIAGETRQVEVFRLNENTYRTVKDVALVRCPQKLRKTIYKMPIDFKGNKEKYRPNLSVWIHTGRGRAKGYHAKAFKWSVDIT